MQATSYKKEGSIGNKSQQTNTNIKKTSKQTKKTSKKQTQKNTHGPCRRAEMSQAQVWHEN